MIGSNNKKQTTRNWKWVIPPLKAQRRGITFIISCTLAMYAGSFIYPLALQHTIDSAINKDIDSFLGLLIISISIMSTEIILSNSRLKKIITLGAILELKLSGILLRSVLSRKYNQAMLTPGNVLNSLNRIKPISDFILQTVPQFALDIGQAVISLLVIAHFHSMIATFLAAALFLSAIIINRYSLQLSEQAESYYKKESHKQNLSSSISSSLRSIKSNTVESFQFKRFIHQSKVTIASSNRVLSSGRSIQLWGTITSRTLAMALLGYCGFAISEGELTLGELITIQILMSRMLTPLIGISDLLKRYQDTKTAIIQIGFILNLPPEPIYSEAHRGETGKKRITVQNLSSIHPDGNIALRNISFQLPYSGLIVLAGANGSGKSTLINALLGLHHYSSGNILLFNKKISPKTFRKKSASLNKIVISLQGRSAKI